MKKLTLAHTQERQAQLKEWAMLKEADTLEYYAVASLVYKDRTD
jgi:hypothetical protein